jgi:hypothetical protein
VPSLPISLACSTRTVLRFSNWDAGRNRRSQIWHAMQDYPLPVPPASILPESPAR